MKSVANANEAGACDLLFFRGAEMAQSFVGFSKNPYETAKGILDLLDIFNMLKVFEAVKAKLRIILSGLSAGGLGFRYDTFATPRTAPSSRPLIPTGRQSSSESVLTPP